MDKPSQPLSPSQACTDLIKRFEGVRLKAYRCPANILTIGVGHTGPDVKAGATWTMAQVDAALAADLTRFTIALRALLVRAKTTQHQFDAMISLMFNIGIAAFARSSILANHLAGRSANAAAAFKLWNKGGGKVLPGLVARRAAEATLYLTK